TEYTVRWYRSLKEKYGDAFPRRTQIRSFDTIQASTVAEANEKLYINREEGFIGTSLKKDEFVCNCSMLDDVIIFYKDGKYKIVKVAEKLFVDKNVLYVNVFKPKDTRTIYNVIYRNGRAGNYYMKRFAVTGITRDREYDLTPGLPGSRILWFSANPNGEAEVVKVVLKPKARLKSLQIDVDFAQLKPKGRSALGNLVTKNEVHRMSLKERGVSTLGGRDVWFDHDVKRINYDGRGEYLGEFQPQDSVLVILNNGEYYTSTFDATNHYEDNILRIEKFRPDQIWTAVLFDADQGYPYLKRFTFEASSRRQRFLGENTASKLILLTDTAGAMLKISFAAPDDIREPITVDVEEFIAVKSFKAKGKRLTTFSLAGVEELEPKPQDETPSDEEAEDRSDEDEDNDDVQDETSDDSNDISDEELRDDIIGQQRLF
nr:DNA gyrase/topoisomerase IV subunit A [Muribaculaceae bacterium]